MNRQQAHELLEDIIKTRNSSEFPFKYNWEQEFREHAEGVAEIASMVAEKCGLDSERAYVYGLLHDGGKVKDEFYTQTFHALEGYCFFKERGYDDLAKISLTHTFLDADFDINDYPYNMEGLLKVKALLQYVEFDEYDKILRLADSINDCGINYTIEDRAKKVAERKPPFAEKIFEQAKKFIKLKEFFDEKCGCDIYEMLGLN